MENAVWYFCVQKYHCGSTMNVHVLKIILPHCCVENKIANFVVILQIWM